LRYTEDVKATIQNGMIDFSEIPLFPRIQWDSILDELKAEHLPGLYQTGKRMGVAIVDGRLRAYVHLTDEMPAEPEIFEILKRHGIEGRS